NDTAIVSISVNAVSLEKNVLDTIQGQWIPLIPGTDVAMILSLANVMIKEDLHDKGFLATHTVGFAKFREYLLGFSDGIDKNPEWASEITGVQSKTITDLARKMASSRTMISVSWSLTRQDHGEQPFWAATALAAMLGQIGLPGGGIGFGYGAVNTIGEEQIVIPAKSISQKTNQLKSFIPVARISDMLLNPGKEYDYDGKKHIYPFIDLIYWAGGNPFHHHQDINKLLRAWQKPSTIIVNDWCWNTSAKHADIILPCATSLERNDFAISRSAYLFYMSKAADPPGKCKTDYEIFSGFAKKLGILDEFTEGRDESDWVEYLYNQSVSRSAEVGIELPEFATFRNKGWHSLEKIAKPLVFLQDFRTKPEENLLPTPSGKIEIFSETIQGYGYEDCQGHPMWYEPTEWLGNKSTEFPLHLISNQPVGKLHSQLDHGTHSRSLKKNGREPIMVNRKNADERGIKSGDTLRIYNGRGSCLATAVVSDRILEDVVQMSTGAWYDPEMPGLIGSLCGHGNPNVLTLDKGTSSLAQGPSAHTCMVQIEKYTGEIPKMRAFEPPDILHHG
ncbi:MAG: molybdopterin-dependent oxidoreductase, partial [Rhodobacteraceae bacterium]|nr:molybdopterin-dependent oxidoreductase [Paracoccaceae bacterium]